MTATKSKRHAMLGKLFCEAAERGMTQEFVRDVVAPAQIGKRLSAASEKEIGRVIIAIAGPQKKTSAHSAPSAVKKYPSSIQGLRDEIKDLAAKRWGDTWEQSLIALCKRFGIDHYIFLDVTHGRAVKQKLLAWQNETADLQAAPTTDEEVPF